MVEQKRILYLTFDFLEPIFSGNGTLSQIQVSGLLKSGYDILIFCPDSGEINSQMTPWVDIGRLVIIPIPIKSIKDLSPSCDWRGFYMKSIKFIKNIREFNPHLIVNPDWHTIDLAIRFKTEFSIPLVGQFFRIFTFFRDYIPNDSDYELVRQKELDLVSNSDLIITLSSFDQNWCFQQGAHNVIVVFPPLTEEFITSLTTFEQDNSQIDDIKLITVSRIVPEKKILRIFPLLKELDNSGVNFSYILVGEFLDKKYEQKVLETIKKLKLSSKIRILGRVSLNSMIKLLKTHSIYMHTSSYEPFGITIIEAAAAGCIVVIDRDGLIGAKEQLNLLPEYTKMVQIDYSDPEQSALTLSNILTSICEEEHCGDDTNILLKLNSKQYMENLVNLFRDFL